MQLPVGASSGKLSTNPLFELWDQFLPRMLCVSFPAFCLPLISLNLQVKQLAKNLENSWWSEQLPLSMSSQRAHSWPGSFEWLDLLDPICGFLITPLGHWFSTWGYWFDPQNHGSLRRCDMALWTLNLSGANKNTEGGKKNFIRASSEVAMSAKWKGRGCFDSCSNKRSIYKGLPSRNCLLWVVMAISLRINNTIYF